MFFPLAAKKMNGKYLCMDKNFKKIKYGNGIGYKLINEIMIDKVIQRLVDHYNLDINKPFNKYFKMADTDDYYDLKQEGHLAYYNINEKNYTYLYLTQLNGVNFCFYIEPHNGKIVSVKHRFADELYKGTMFEGKIVKAENDRYYYLISDLVILTNHVHKPGKNGEMYFSMDTFTLETMRKINKILDTEFVSDPVLDVVHIELLDFVHYRYIQSLMTDYLNRVPYSNCVKGLILRPTSNVRTNIIYIFNGGVHKDLKLPKYTESKTQIKKTAIQIDTLKRTICFKLKKTRKPDVYELFLRDGSSECFYDIASVPDMKNSHLIHSFFPKTYHYIIASCRYDPKFKRWTPFRKSERKTPDDICIFESS